jgi:diaminopimelate epimerase
MNPVYRQEMIEISFTKMHGLGNDFAVLDARDQALPVSAGQASAIADRRRGIGCDQVIVLRPSHQAPVRMDIYNADGGRVAACGNATRCVAALLLAGQPMGQILIETDAGILEASNGPDGQTTVNMGQARLGWQEIPLSHPMDTLALDISLDGFSQPSAVGMGNPHAVFFVPDLGAVDMERLGRAIECHPWFPQRTNVEAVQVMDGTRLKMRVWERGVGMTPACGTGACAVAVAAVRRELAARNVSVEMDGGVLDIEYRENGDVWMRGAAAVSFRGVIAL